MVINGETRAQNETGDMPEDFKNLIDEVQGFNTWY